MYKRVDLKEDVLVQFVAVHAVRWNPEWGQPSVGFIEDDDPVAAAAPELLAACEGAKIALEGCEIALNGLGVEAPLGFFAVLSAIGAAIAKARGES